MAHALPWVVPELDVGDLRASLAFYVDLLGFEIAAERPEEAFAYLVRGEAHLMIEGADGPGRRFRTAPLERPFGRGINLQVRVDHVEALDVALRAAGTLLVVPLETRWYRQGAVEHGQRQLVVADPDGYLLRLFEPLGSRPASPA